MLISDVLGELNKYTSEWFFVEVIPINREIIITIINCVLKLYFIFRKNLFVIICT